MEYCIEIVRINGTCSKVYRATTLEDCKSFGMTCLKALAGMDSRFQNYRVKNKAGEVLYSLVDCHSFN